MILDEWVELRWSGNMKSWYESRGYVYTKKDERFKVKVSDLQSGSSVKVRVECDGCGKYKVIRYNAYNEVIEHQGIYQCSGCTKRTPISKVVSDFEAKGYIPLFTDYKDQLTRLKFRCSKHLAVVQETNYLNIKRTKDNCYFCFEENNSGQNASNWQGGITNIKNYLRKGSLKWISQQLYQANYRCELSGVTHDVEVHHLNLPFTAIVKAAFEESGISLKASVTEYTDEELAQLLNIVESKHSNITSLCINYNLHHELHKLFTYKTTTEDCIKFTEMYANGELDYIDVHIRRKNRPKYKGVKPQEDA